MRSKQNINLVKGTFSPEDAKLILFNLITHKINFHSMKNFSSEERLGKPEKGSKKRIEHLKACRDKVFALIEIAKEQKYDLNIHSDIIITLNK